MNQTPSQQFATAWIESWNNHYLDAIMSHYTEEIEFISPFVVRLNKDESGTVRGKAELRSYFQKGLETYPDLKFELHNVLVGVGSVTLYYRSVKNLMAAEVMIFNEAGKIVKVLAHYA